MWITTGAVLTPFKAWKINDTKRHRGFTATTERVFTFP